MALALAEVIVHNGRKGKHSDVCRNGYNKHYCHYRNENFAESICTGLFHDKPPFLYVKPS